MAHIEVNIEENDGLIVRFEAEHRDMGALIIGVTRRLLALYSAEVTATQEANAVVASVVGKMMQPFTDAIAKLGASVKPDLDEVRDEVTKPDAEESDIGRRNLAEWPAVDAAFESLTRDDEDPTELIPVVATPGDV